MLPRVLLADPFTKGSAVNLEESDGQRKKSALDRRMEFDRAWQSVNKPEPQVGQVWVVSAREVVVTELLTHYNTPDRLQLPEPRLRWRSRPKGKTGVESVSIFMQRYAPAWLPGDSPLVEDIDEEQLDETVQQVRKYLDGNHQVIDFGTVGLFRTYFVKELSDDYVLSTLQYVVPGEKKGRQAAEAWLKQPHPVADYWKSRNADGMDSPYSGVLDVQTISHIRQNIERASGAITGLGIPRQRDVLILLDLSKKTNTITGGGVGGYAYRRTHAIEADSAYMATANGVELLVHEWGHKKFFNLPQHVTKFVREWFEENVAQHAESKYAPLVSERDQAQVVIAAWAAFALSWKKWEGIYPEQYAQLKKRAKETKHGDDSALLDVFLAPSMSAVGKLNKGVKNEREGYDGAQSLRKGTRVWAISARAVIPDGYALIPLKGGTPSGKDAIYVSRDVVYASLELDAEASAKKNDTNLGTIAYRLHTLQLPDEPGEEREDNYFTRDSSMSSFIDDAVNAAADRIQKKYPQAPTMSLMPPNVRSIFVDEWIAQVRREGDRFDPKAAFEKLFKSNADWSLGMTIDPAVRLSTPYGTDVRDALAKLGITPSSYAASNVDELWAELIATAALNPNKVPKPLKAMLRDAIQGKTPGPGQRVKQDNTPTQFRKPVSEAVVLLGASPFLDEAYDPTALQRAKDALDAFDREYPRPSEIRVLAGTSNRKRLQREAFEQWAKAESVYRTARYPLAAAYRAVVQREVRSSAAKTRASEPESVMRRKVFAHLRRMGFKRETVSGASAYYQRGLLKVRVSDHEVPLTAEREHNIKQGGMSWANSSRSIVIDPRDPVGAARWLVEIRRLVRAEDPHFEESTVGEAVVELDESDDHGWPRKHGFKRDDEEVAEAVVLLDRSPFA